MRYLKPHYYDKFVCTADKCPDTCCAGWQIVIDEASLERYEAESSVFGNRLRNSIDWEEGVFYQYDGRCSFLNENNLCDLYSAIGPDALCDTCRMYPRHVEEYEGLRELSLSLSCPVAARMILGCTDKVEFLESFTDEEDDFEDFDFLMFSQLEDARDVIVKILQNRKVRLSWRMAAVEQLAEEFQECVDDGRSWEIDEILEKYEKANERGELGETAESVPGMQTTYERRRQELEMLEGLEHLRPEWTKMLRQAERRLYAPGEEAYSERLWEFEAYLENAEFDPVGGEDIADGETVGGNGTCADKPACGKETADKDAACADSEPGHLTWEILGEQLMMFFVYTYFCGSVYDDMVSAKMGLAVLSVTWIKELCMLSWLENEKTLSFEQVVETAYCFAREVEHSDDNLNMLEEWLDGGYEEAREVTAGNRRKR